MQTYFNSTDNSGGMACEGQASMADVFNTVKEFHEKSFQDIGGNYTARDEHEKTCAIRLPPTVFFKVSLGLGLTVWVWVRIRDARLFRRCELALGRAGLLLTNTVPVFMWNLGNT